MVPQTMGLQSNDFEIFGLEQKFTQDKAQIQMQWRQLQRRFHPDKFTHESSVMQRLAEQWSARINESYKRLCDDLARIQYLCELKGYPFGRDAMSQSNHDFLLQQLSWREELEEASSKEDLLQLGQEIDVKKQTFLSECAEVLDRENSEPEDGERVAAALYQLMFIHKIEIDLKKHLTRY